MTLKQRKSVVNKENVLSSPVMVKMYVRSCDSHSAVVVNAVDFPTDEDADPAIAPFTPVGQQVGNEQSQTCRKTQSSKILALAA